MVHVIMGLKGSGKTKQLVDLVRAAVDKDSGDVVVIEKDNALTYDIPYQARLVDASAYPIGSYEFIKGFLCGIHSGNYDITHVFVDNFLKMVDDRRNESLVSFVNWLDAFSAKENIEYFLSVSMAVEDCPEGLKRYIG